MNAKRTGKHVGIVITIVVVIAAIACALFVWMNVRGSERSVDTAQTLESDAENVVALMDTVQEMDARGTDTEEIYEYFSSLSWMETVCIEEDGSVSFLTEAGILGDWSPEEGEDYISVGSASSAAEVFDDFRQEVDTYTGEGLDIVILCPFATEDERFILDGYERIADNIADMADGSVTVLEDEEVSLDALKTLDEYDMVFYYAHGRTHSAEDSGESDRGSSYTSTGEFVHSASEMYDLFATYHSAVSVNSQTGRVSIGGNFYTMQYEENAFQDMFFHYGSCRSLQTNTISDALLSLGASWVEGWDNKVTFKNDYVHFDYMTEYLMEGYSAAEAFDLVQQTEEAQIYAEEGCNFTGRGEGTFRITAEQSESDAEEKENPEPVEEAAGEKENPEPVEEAAEEKENPEPVGESAGESMTEPEEQEVTGEDKTVSEKKEEPAEEKVNPSFESALFADMDGHQFYFMNGADIWNSYLLIHSDGTFEGIYSNWTGEGKSAQGKSYLNAYYYNEFTGSLSEPKQISEYIYSTTVLSLQNKYTPGTESMIDGSMHIFTEPDGIAKGDEIWIYLPETPVSELGNGIMNLVLSQLGGESILGDYLLYNTSETGIFL